MAKIFNRKKQKRLRQAFRNSPTKAEALVWSALKGKQLSGFKFRRQQGVGSYILDFYCPMAKLGVEIDGETQWTKRERLHDQRKEDYIGKFGVRVIRFTNKDVYENLDGVLEEIAEAATNRLLIIQRQNESTDG